MCCPFFHETRLGTEPSDRQFGLNWLNCCFEPVQLLWPWILVILATFDQFHGSEPDQTKQSPSSAQTKFNQPVQSGVTRHQYRLPPYEQILYRVLGSSLVFVIYTIHAVMSSSKWLFFFLVLCVCVTWTDVFRPFFSFLDR